MSDSTFYPEQGSRSPYMKRVQGKVVFGSSAISSSAVSGATVTRSAAGTYTVTLDSAYNKLKNVAIVVNANNTTTPTDLTPQLYVVTPQSSVIKFWLLTGTVPTDPTDGHEAYIELGFSDTELDY